MILSDIDILAEVRAERIRIFPFDEAMLNPNSYNVHLYDELLSYRIQTPNILDASQPNETNKFTILDCGFILYPGILYLGRTIEYTETYGLVPMLEGRSSLARLGISVHASAGFGDNGFCGYWTLELSVIQPVRIYAGIEIAQLFWHTMLTPGSTYEGKYQNNQGTQASLSDQDFK